MKRECPHCGHKFGGKEIEHIIRKELEVELQPLKKYEDLLEHLEGKSYFELDIIRQIKGYSKYWVLHQLSSVEDLKGWAETMGYKPGWVWWQVEKNGWKPKSLKERINEFNNFKKH